jgi:hypothetical protein
MMLHLLCRNKVKDYDFWKGGFDSDRAAQQRAGLTLLNLWRSADDPNEVFFLFQVTDRTQAEDFMHSPEAAQAIRKYGVLAGASWFLR